MANSIQDRLSEALVARGMTPAELARAVGVSNGYVSKLLSGYISQPKKNLSAICTALRIKEKWLLTGKGEVEVDDINEIISYPLMPVYEVFNPEEESELYSIPCLIENKKNNLKAYRIRESELFNTELNVVVDINGNGSGLFLIVYNDNALISTRFDHVVSVKWVHNTNKIVDNFNFKVLGKIVQLTSIDEEDIWM
ncbi:helix-turn-helix transcriptional regulator (plasmid) [Serratia sp. PAMC26656]|uniref:helix-turn-helix domain-containing protein n=1 Tax=Serratia sp. PAMC26656 TaxID=2775909 RepID=UPI0018F587C3|nr:helix-turn-helix transcriptional regulator [Serratia sp. PAMC26656]MBJ7889533.1 helix-turn-helix transcriptional regulator [Serratia sp. PAMC26656]